MNRIIEPEILTRNSGRADMNRFVERAEDLVPIFGEYFNFIRSHEYLPWVDGTTLPKNTLFVFPDLPYLGLNIVGTVVLPNLEYYNDRFFDIDDNYAFFDFNGISSTNPNYLSSIQIRFNERVIGKYVRETNTLIMSDISHNIDCIRVIRELFPYLYEALKFEKVPTEEAIKPSPLKTTITVGCDPEFEVVDSHGITSAENYLSDGHHEEEIGLDGAGSQLELRPNSGTPTEVVTHLHSLFNKFVREYPNLRLATSGHSYPLGGHIHIGIGFSLHPPASLLKLLDDFIGSPTINLSGSARECYKKLGAYEPKPWGFEYRTPPALIFHNKKIAKIFLKLAKNLVKIYINKGNSNGRIFYHSPLTKEDYKVVGGLNNGEVKYLLSFLHEMKEPVRKEELLIAAWGLNTTPMIISKEIKFYSSEEWNRDCYNEFVRTIKGVISGLIIKKDISVTLSGFKQSRGEVCNISSEFIRTENECGYGEMFYPIKNGNFVFYLPWSVRNDVYLPEEIFYGVAKEIGDFIKRYL